MDKKSAKDCIATADIEVAIENYNNATPRWKNHWWSTVTTIYNASVKFAKTYVIDPINKTIKKLITLLSSAFEFTEKGNYCYWINLINKNNEVVWTKIGTTRDVPNKRWLQILKERYCKQNDVVRCEAVKVWDCGNLPSECLESYFRAMLGKKYGGKNFVPNDRFAIGNEYELPTVAEMTNWANNFLGIEG